MIPPHHIYQIYHCLGKLIALNEIVVNYQNTLTTLTLRWRSLHTISFDIPVVEHWLGWEEPNKRMDLHTSPR